jgi:transposase
VRADLQSLSFGLFMQRLRGFIKSHRMDIMLLEVEEHETSQVCGNPECEAVVKIGGAEVYHCQHCGQSYHRDCMAARNIFLKVGALCALKTAATLPPFSPARRRCTITTLCCPAS